MVLVTPAGVYPIPGWVDTLNGPMGLLVGAGKGVIRSMHCKGENRAQVIPVDMAISAIIFIAYQLGAAKTKYVPTNIFCDNKTLRLINF